MKTKSACRVPGRGVCPPVGDSHTAAPYAFVGLSPPAPGHIGAALGGHDWPAPIQKDVGNALHNALAAGNCSAFAPWQVTESSKSIHALMTMSTYTPKTYTAMHYTKFIRPGARRIDAEPGFATVQVGAFLHEKDGDATVVALNPTDQNQALNLSFRNLKGLASLKAYRTSASENLAIGEVPVRDNKAAFEMTPQSIVTFSGKIHP